MEYGGVEVLFHSLLISAVDEDESRFTPDIYFVGPTAGLDAFGGEINLLRLPGIEARFLKRPSTSLVTVPTTLAQLQILSSYKRNDVNTVYLKTATGRSIVVRVNREKCLKRKLSDRSEIK
jgi:hypothetical protein